MTHEHPLVPHPLSPDEVADLVRRVRAKAVVPDASPKDATRARLSRGDRVRRTAYLAHLVPRARAGVVVGFGKHAGTVRVRLDGNQTAATWLAACWEATGETGDAAPPPPRERREPRMWLASMMVTRSELRALHREAEALGVSLSKMLRGRVLGGETPPGLTRA